MNSLSNKFAWEPTPEFVEGNRLKAFIDELGLADHDALLTWADVDPDRFWTALIDFMGIQFTKPYETVRDISTGRAWSDWCVGGETNHALNVLDRHRGSEIMDKTFCIYEAEDGSVRKMLYADLDRESCRLANALVAMGLGKDDPVAIYMPMVPEVAAAFLAVARIGGLVVPLFSGFAAEAIVTRLTDCDAKGCITVDGTRRRGSVVDMKSILDDALEHVESVENVIVFENLGNEVKLLEGRDHDWSELLAAQSDHCDTVMVASNHPLLLVYTSGTTGKPKGAIASHFGFTVKIPQDLTMYLDLRQSDTMIWMSDFGWVVGPATITATLAAGATMVMAEGAPDYPQQGRLWRMIADYKVSFLGIAPTAVRSLMRHGVEEARKYDLSSVRVAASTGEPWTEEAWLWLFQNIGGGRAPILNWSGGTEIGGGIIASNVLTPQKPCSLSGSIAGMTADIVDAEGNPVASNQLGELIMHEPSPGLTRGLWRDEKRYLETYWSMFEDKWRHGDWAYRDEDGLWYVTGRSDDTLNISGKRVGPAEIEGVLNSTGRVVESAVVGVPDPISGTAVMCVCVPGESELADDLQGDDLKADLADAVVQSMGKSFRPKHLLFVSDLPKTRTLKIMRRVIRALVLAEDPGDLSSLVNPEAVEELKQLGGKIATRE